MNKTQLKSKVGEKESVKISLNQTAIEEIILRHVFEKYGGALGVKTIDDIDWNDYSLMVPYDTGLWFTKK